ncbi:MAG: site-2 protease family protein [Candidatus Aenigmarchaeota archaeon]|nr:site-2 protease family protein [Candidatus Aenigmarchaeota archaeon]
MIDPYLLAGLVIFFGGVLLLSRTKAKRYFVLFMFETRHGFKFVDKFARLSPPLWKFLGDFATVVSFGGFGAYYVSRYRNTWQITGLLGLGCIFLTYLNFGLIPSVTGLLVLVAGVILLKRTEKPAVHLLATTIVMGIMMFNIYPNFSNIEFLRPYISILVGIFGIPAFLISLLFSHAFRIIVEQSQIPGVSPLLPGIGEEGFGFFFPGTGIFIPFWQALIAIIALLVPHEFAHGVLTRCHDIKLKSAGILTAGPIPIGAFVEPDQKEMEKHEGRERMRIYAAGSFTNLIFSSIALFLLVSVMAPMMDTITEPTGMVITNVINDTPAHGVLERGFVINEINGMRTLDIESFHSALSDIKPGQTISLLTTNGTFDLTLAEHPENSSRGYIGIDLQEKFEIRDEFKNEYKMQADVILFLTPTLFWVFFLSFNIALVNLLPIIPFDGGKMFEEYMREFGVSKKRKDLLLKVVIAIILALLLVNASPLLYLLLNMIGA